MAELSLSQVLVTKYCRRNARVNSFKKWFKDVKEEIRDALQAGTECPKRGPWIITLSPKESKPYQAPVDWEKEWKKLAKKQWPNTWKEKVKDLVDGQPMVPSEPLTPSLNVVANPDYKT